MTVSKNFQEFVEPPLWGAIRREFVAEVQAIQQGVVPPKKDEASLVRAYSDAKKRGDFRAETTAWTDLEKLRASPAPTEPDKHRVRVYFAPNFSSHAGELLRVRFKGALVFLEIKAADVNKTVHVQLVRNIDSLDLALARGSVLPEPGPGIEFEGV